MLRPIVATFLLGAAVGSVLAAGVGLARAEDPSSTVSIDNFTFSPKELKVKAGTTVTWTNHDDIPHGIASSNNAFKKSKAATLTTAIPLSSPRRGPTNTSVIYTPTWLARSSSNRQRVTTLRSDVAISDNKHGSIRHRSDPVVEQERMPDTFHEGRTLCLTQVNVKSEKVYSNAISVVKRKSTTHLSKKRHAAKMLLGTCTD